MLNILSRLVLILIGLSVGCAPAPRYVSHVTRGAESESKDQMTGVASYYGKGFHGRQTANGEVFDMYDLTAAHKTLPFNTLVKVTNLGNMKTVKVRINDRGPFVKNRIIDLSYGAAKKIDMISSGTVRVRLEIVGSGDSK